MLLLNDLIDKVSKDTFFRIIGVDNKQNKTWSVWKGYQWQFIKDAIIENCEVLSISRKWFDDDFIIFVNAEYDNYKGGLLYGFEYKK